MESGASGIRLEKIYSVPNEYLSILVGYCFNGGCAMTQYNNGSLVISGIVGSMSILYSWPSIIRGTFSCVVGSLNRYLTQQYHS